MSCLGDGPQHPRPAETSHNTRHRSSGRRAHIKSILASFSKEISVLEGHAAPDCPQPTSPRDEIIRNDDITSACSSTAASSMWQSRPAPSTEDGCYVHGANCTKGTSVQSDDGAALAVAAIKAMAHDHVVMKRNIGDYDTALRATVAEVHHLRSELSNMQRACHQASELQELLASEVGAQEELHHENAHLTQRNAILTSIIHEALDSKGDIEREAFIDSLTAENNMLWKMVQISQSASGTSGAALQVAPTLRRGSFPRTSGRIRSPSCSTPSNSSSPQPRSADSPPLRALQFSQDSPPQQAATNEDSDIVDSRGAECDVHVAPAALSSNSSSSSSSGNETNSHSAISVDAQVLPSKPVVESLVPVAETALDDDDISEVSSLVESAIFIGAPAVSSDSFVQEPEASPRDVSTSSEGSRPAHLSCPSAAATMVSPDT